jgi:hypothetical protein
VTLDGPAGIRLAGCERTVSAPGLVEVADVAGWTPVYAHVSDAADRDAHEWSWFGSLGEGYPHRRRAMAVA